MRVKASLMLHTNIFIFYFFIFLSLSSSIRQTNYKTEIYSIHIYAEIYFEQYAHSRLYHKLPLFAWAYAWLARFIARVVYPLNRKKITNCFIYTHNVHIKIIKILNFACTNKLFNCFNIKIVIIIFFIIFFIIYPPKFFPPHHTHIYTHAFYTYIGQWTFLFVLLLFLFFFPSINY